MFAKTNGGSMRCICVFFFTTCIKDVLFLLCHILFRKKTTHIMNFLKQFFISFGLMTGLFHVVQAQQIGVRGVVMDLESVKPMEGVTLQILHTTYGATTDANGEFFINLPKNKDIEHVIVATMMGYTSDSVRFTLFANDVEFVNLSLLSESSVLDEVVVTRRRERVSEIALLDMRRRSNLMVEVIGAQELSRKGVSDAATAVSRMTGVSKQEGSTQVYVRGLGDRYNSTTLNGLPIPSSNPSEKNLPLDVFTTDIIDYISVDKVYHSAMPGDFGGANVDIVSKDFSGDRLVEFSVGGSANTNALDRAGNFRLQPGPNYSGFSNTTPPNNITQQYGFQDGMDFVAKNQVPLSVGFKAGDSFRVGDGSRLSLFATGNFANGFEFREGLNQTVNAQGARLRSFHQERASYKTNTTGLFNANYLHNDNHRLSYNFLFVNATNQFSDQFLGYMVDYAEDTDALWQRGTYEQNQLYVNQLLGKHTLHERITLDWGVGYNKVSGDIPDRAQTIQRFNNSVDGFVFHQNDASNNHRFFQNLVEDEWVANVKAVYAIGEDNRGNIALGYQGRIKSRDFEAIQANLNVDPSYRTIPVNPLERDLFFNESNYLSGIFGIQAFAGDSPQTYQGNQRIHALYTSLDYRLTDKLVSVIGLRYDNIFQDIDWYTNLSAGYNQFRRNFILPNLSLKYELTEMQNLRLGASKSYTLPQFKETARFQYEEVTETEIGNPYLYPSQNYNLDLKWELFPKTTELVSVGLFGKYIQDPINRITIASASNDMSYINTGDFGYVYGAEIEIKKDLGFLSDNYNKFAVGLNTALMRTHQELNEEKVRAETNGLFVINTEGTSSFTGAADLIINGDLSYTRNLANGRNISGTVVYNYYSDKLYAIGTQGKGSIVDLGVSSLDFVLRSKVSNRIGLDFVARNLLNPAYQREQLNDNGHVLVMSYTKGFAFSLGIKYAL